MEPKLGATGNSAVTVLSIKEMACQIAVRVSRAGRPIAPGRRRRPPSRTRRSTQRTWIGVYLSRRADGVGTTPTAEANDPTLSLLTHMLTALNERGGSSKNSRATGKFKHERAD
jgi:hypothetical protein